jgi:hypothetical protein
MIRKDPLERDILEHLQQHFYINGIVCAFYEGDATTGYHLRLTYRCRTKTITANCCLYDGDILIASDGQYGDFHFGTLMIPLAAPNCFDQLVKIVKTAAGTEEGS